MRRAEFVTAFLLGIFSLYIMWKSGEPPSWDPSVQRFANIGMIDGEGPGAGWWPFWLGLGMLLSCIWIMINCWRRTSPISRSEEPFLDNYGMKMLLLVGGGLVAFLALIHVIGFYFAIFVFMLYYMIFLGRHSIVKSTIIATSIPVISFFFFDIAMRIVLPKGLSEPLFIPLYELFL